MDAEDANNKLLPFNEDNYLLDLQYMTTHNRKIPLYLIENIIEELTIAPSWELLFQVIESWPLFCQSQITDLKDIIQTLIADDLHCRRWFQKQDDAIEDTFCSYECTQSKPPSDNKMDSCKLTRSNHCTHCNARFGKSATEVNIGCDFCRNPNYDSHIWEMIIVGQYRNRAICRIDAKRSPFFIQIEEDIKQWRYVTLFQEDHKDGYSYFVGIPPHRKVQISIDSWHIAHRTCRIKTEQAKIYIVDYQKQKDYLIYKKPRNVRYHKSLITANFRDGQQLLHKNFPKSTNAGLNFKDKEVNIWFGQHGDIQMNNYFGFYDGMLNEIDGLPDMLLKYEQFMNDILGIEVHPLDTELCQLLCHVFFYKILHGKVLLRGMSEGIGYKGVEPCGSGITDEQRQSKFVENHKTNKFDAYLPQKYVDQLRNIHHKIKRHETLKNDEMVKEYQQERETTTTKLKQNISSSKFVPVKNNLSKYITENYPEIIPIKKALKYKNCVINMSLAIAFPALAPTLTKYITKGILDGNEYNQIDSAIYSGHDEGKTNGYSVPGHNDIDPLMNSTCQNMIFVDKIGLNSGSSCLCHNDVGGGQSSNCACPDVNIHHPNYGGHQEIGNRTSYGMIGRGASRGSQHCLHGYQKRKSGIPAGFDTTQYSVIYRPRT